MTRVPCPPETIERMVVSLVDMPKTWVIAQRKVGGGAPASCWWVFAVSGGQRTKVMASGAYAAAEGVLHRGLVFEETFSSRAAATARAASMPGEGVKV